MGVAGWLVKAFDTPALLDLNVDGDLQVLVGCWYTLLSYSHAATVLSF